MGVIVFGGVLSYVVNAGVAPLLSFRRLLGSSSHSVLPLLAQPYIADWGPAPDSRPPPTRRPLPWLTPSRTWKPETPDSLPGTARAVGLLLFAAMTNPNAMDSLSSCLGLV